MQTTPYLDDVITPERIVISMHRIQHVHVEFLWSSERTLTLPVAVYRQRGGHVAMHVAVG